MFNIILISITFLKLAYIFTLYKGSIIYDICNSAFDKAVVLKRFLTGMPGRFDTARGDPRLHGVIVTADENTGRATAIERLSLSPADIETHEQMKIER